MQSTPEPRMADGRDFARPTPVSSAPNSPAVHTTRPFSPQQAVRPPSTPELSPRTQPGVQWSNTVPLLQPALVPGSPVELSPVDLKWGVLFGLNGHPTKRWEQIIRGLGRYLVSTAQDEKKNIPDG